MGWHATYLAHDILQGEDNDEKKRYPSSYCRSDNGLELRELEVLRRPARVREDTECVQPRMQCRGETGSG